MQLEEPDQPSVRIWPEEDFEKEAILWNDVRNIVVHNNIINNFFTANIFVIYGAFNDSRQWVDVKTIKPIRSQCHWKSETRHTMHSGHIFSFVYGPNATVIGVSLSERPGTVARYNGQLVFQSDSLTFQSNRFKSYFTEISLFNITIRFVEAKDRSLDLEITFGSTSNNEKCVISIFDRVPDLKWTPCEDDLHKEKCIIKDGQVSFGTANLVTAYIYNESCVPFLLYLQEFGPLENRSTEHSTCINVKYINPGQAWYGQTWQTAHSGSYFSISNLTMTKFSRFHHRNTLGTVRWSTRGSFGIVKAHVSRAEWMESLEEIFLESDNVGAKVKFKVNRDRTVGLYIHLKTLSF